MSVYSTDLVVLDLQAAEKFDAVQQLAKIVVASGRGTNATKIATDVMARDALGTPQVDGVAIPHARSSGVSVPSVVVARTAGVVFDPDEDAADVIFMILVPDGEGDEHIVILSGLARRLMDPSFTQELRSAQSAQEIVDLLSNGDV